MMNANTAATLVGAALTAGTAAEPVLAAVQGTMHTQNWVQLGIAVGTALFGWFTKFKTKNG